MPSLKALRGRIVSVTSTQKITSAMKMVAASKLRRAQNQAGAAKPYAERMERMLAALAAAASGGPGAPKLLAGTGNDKTHLLVAITGDRGLAGAFNANIGRMTRARVGKLRAEGKAVKIFAVGRKGTDYLSHEFPDLVVDSVNYAGRKSINFADAQAIAGRITALLEAGEFDVCTLLYNRFHSVISQVPTATQLIPAPKPEAAAAEGVHAIVEFEPAEEEMLAQLLPLNLAVQIYRAQLESAAGFYGSQMAAMDNATRNAGDMIKSLTLRYNRARQANITNELIEIISGAEAV